MAEAVRPKERHKKTKVKSKHRSQHVVKDEMQATNVDSQEKLICDALSKLDEINFEPLLDDVEETALQPTIVDVDVIGTKGEEVPKLEETSPKEVVVQHQMASSEDDCALQDAATTDDSKSVPELLEDFNRSIASVMNITQAFSTSAVSSNETSSTNRECLTFDRMEDQLIPPPPYCLSEELNAFLPQNPYENLRQALNVLSTESFDVGIASPSAPAFHENVVDHDTNLIVSEHSVCDTEQQHRPLVAHRKISHKLESFVVRPFSETQLMALYHNAEFEANDQFIGDFISNNLHTENSEFQELVMGYLRARVNLVSCTKAYEALVKDYKKQVEGVWETVEKVAQAKGKCLDRVTLVGTHKYSMAVYNKDHAEELQKVLKNIHSTVHDSYTLHAYEVEMSKLQIESYLYRLLSSVSMVSEIPRNAPLQVYQNGCRPAELTSQIEIIKSCISVLFSVQRKPWKDPLSLQDTRNWLTNLVAVLLRLSTFGDHLFLLNHVLRLPAGIGNWAAAYIQVPLPPVVDNIYSLQGVHLDHILTVLATILLPVRAREDFLQNLRTDSSATSVEAVDDLLWVVVDSEGEEDEDPVNYWLHWRENDLVALLNQIPIASVFRCLLRICARDGVDFYDCHNVYEHDFIRVFAFATHLIHLFREGLKTFDLARYRQLMKRISQLIRHTVLYVSDHWEQFILANPGLPVPSKMRLQAEYDQFFLRSTYSIFSSQKFGAWQFMAAMPYNCVSVEMLWKILWLLHNDYVEDLEAVEQKLENGDWRNSLQCEQLQLNFEERLSSMPQSEAYYLLTAFANMACSRRLEESGIVDSICREMFQISFINEHTKELCSKWGRELLYTITTKHPFIISLLVELVKLSIDKIGKISIYLFCELPVYLWEPSECDISTIISWLVDFLPSTVQNQLAQIILSSMNWDFDGSGSRLFLDVSFHRRMVLAILQSFQKHVQITKGSFISESFKQVTSLASAALRKDTNPNEAFAQWAWEILMSLRVHLYQQPSSLLLNTSANFVVPDLHNDQSMSEVLWSFRQKHPVAIFIGFTMTKIGHNVANFTEKLDYLVTFVELQNYEAILHILCHTVPLFFNCGHYLWTSKRFLTIITSVLTPDLSYVKMAKNIVSSVFPGKVLQCFAGMIEHQIQISDKVGWEVNGVLQFWMELFTSFPYWYKDQNVLYLLDAVFQACFLYGSTVCQNVLAKKFMNEASSQGASSTFTSLVSWLATGSGVPVTLVSKHNYSKFVWFSHYTLEMETQTSHEEKLWKNTLRNLAANSSLTPDAALKRALSNTENMVPPPVRHLPVYRWAELVLEIPLDHPLLPIIWQRFFMLFLYRVPQTSRTGFGDCGSVGERFFSNTCDIPLFKKLKRRLEEMTESHKKEFSQDSSVLDEAQASECLFDERVKKQYEAVVFHEKLTRLYRTFYLWLEEPRLHDPTLYLPSLPAEYDPGRLLALFQHNKDPWLEFVLFDNINDERKLLLDVWNSRCLEKYRRPGWKHCANHKLISSNETGVENLLKRLQTYEQSLPVPCITPMKQVVPELPQFVFGSSRTVVDCVNTHLVTLCNYATLVIDMLVPFENICFSVFSERAANHVAIDCNYQELSPQLYRNIKTEVCLQVECCKREEGNKCLGPARIVLTFNEKKIISSVQHSMEQNRTEWSVLLNESLIGPPVNVCSASVFIESVVSNLVNAYRVSEEQNGSSNVVLRDAGVNLFYHFCGFLNSRSEQYPPARHFLTSCIEILGTEIIQKHGDQCDQLLSLILQSPWLVGVLAPHFSPNRAKCNVFVKLYQRVVKLSRTCGIDITFVVLSKFDVKCWLVEERPTLPEREQIVKAIFDVLIHLGPNPDSKYLGISALYRQHLCILLLYKFPDVYREIFEFITKAMANKILDVNVFYDFLNAIINNDVEFAVKVSVDSSVDDMCSISHRFAQSQELFSHDELQESLAHLGGKYMEQRASSKEFLLQTLYTICGVYTKPATIFISLMSHAYIASIKREMLNLQKTLDFHEVWNVLQNTFAPWLLPVEDENKLWQPWISGQECLASVVVILFRSCIDFANKTLLTSANILVLFLDMYFNELAKPLVEEYILDVWHKVFSSLSWSTLWPDSSTIDLMAKILDTSLTECSKFLGGVFLEIGWPEVVHHIVQHESHPIVVHTMNNLLKLHVCLSLEVNVEQQDAVVKLLQSAHNYHWELIDCHSYDHVVRWFLSRCDPQCVLVDDNLKESTVISLLQSAAEFVPGIDHASSDVLQKRICYVHSCIHLLCECAEKNKVLLRSRMELFKDVLLNLLRQIEAVLVTGPNRDTFHDDSVALLKEVLNVLNVASVTCLQDIAVKAFQDWAKAYPRSPILGDFLQSASQSLASVSHMATLIETLLDSYFSIEADLSIPGAGWSCLHSAIVVPELTEQKLIAECLNNSYFLTLNALAAVLQCQCKSADDEFRVLALMVEWTEKAKPQDENEHKLLLIWWRVLEATVRLRGNLSTQHICQLLVSLSISMGVFGEDKSSQGFWATFGLGRRSPLSLKFRCIARCMNAFVLSQVKRLHLGTEDLTDVSGQTKINAPKHAQLALHALETTKNAKQYSEFKEYLECSLGYVNSDVHTLKDGICLLSYLSRLMYPDRHCLSVMYC